VFKCCVQQFANVLIDIIKKPINQNCTMLLCYIQSLSHCESVTDDGVRHIGTGAGAPEFLTVLELDNCPLISDAALEHLSGCQVLQRIELYDCQLITRAGIRRLKVQFWFYWIISTILIVRYSSSRLTNSWAID